MSQEWMLLPVTSHHFRLPFSEKESLIVIVIPRYSVVWQEFWVFSVMYCCDNVDRYLRFSCERTPFQSNTAIRKRKSRMPFLTSPVSSWSSWSCVFRGIYRQVNACVELMRIFSTSLQNNFNKAYHLIWLLTNYKMLVCHLSAVPHIQCWVTIKISLRFAHSLCSQHLISCLHAVHF